MDLSKENLTKVKDNVPQASTPCLTPFFIPVIPFNQVRNAKWYKYWKLSLFI